MSCNGCRVLRRGCSENCILKPCLGWISTPQAQSNATKFLSKFFGRSDLLAKIADVSPNHRPALFQSLLLEACGRMINPVYGAVGLLNTGNWHLCLEAMETVLSGGVLHPYIIPTSVPNLDTSETSLHEVEVVMESQPSDGMPISLPRKGSSSGSSDVSNAIPDVEGPSGVNGGVEPKLLNLFI